MKKLLIILSCFLVFGIGCKTTSTIDKATGLVNKTKAKIKKDFEIKIKLKPKNTKVKEDPDAVVIVKNKKTGKKWIFTHKEFHLIMDSFDNWVLVANTDPEISKVQQDKTYLYITFNYHTRQNNGRTKTSVLSGIIIIKKSYVENKAKIKFWKGVSIGSTVAGGVGWLGFIIMCIIFL